MLLYNFDYGLLKSPHGSLHLPVHLHLLLVADIIIFWRGLENPGSNHVGPQHQESSARSQQQQQPEPARHDGEGLRQGSQDYQVLSRCKSQR